MEVTAGSSHCSEKKPHLESCLAVHESQSGPQKKDSSATGFVNHAAIAWHESRRKWTGNQPQHSKPPVKDPVICWSTTYEELLSTTEPFSESIPLQEMVDFLVDIWHAEGLFD